MVGILRVAAVDLRGSLQKSCRLVYGRRTMYGEAKTAFGDSLPIGVVRSVRASLPFEPLEAAT
jgi:hypothetical protein